MSTFWSGLTEDLVIILFATLLAVGIITLCGGHADILGTFTVITLARVIWIAIRGPRR